MTQSDRFDRFFELLDEARRLREELGGRREGRVLRPVLARAGVGNAALDVFLNVPELDSARARLEKLEQEPAAAAGTPSPEPRVSLAGGVLLLVLVVLVPALLPQVTPAHLFVAGLLLMSAAVVLAFGYPDLNRLQSCIVAVVLATGTSLVALFLSGFLQIEIAWLKAGGAMAVFVLALYVLLKYGVLDSVGAGDSGRREGRAAAADRPAAPDS